MPVKQKKTDSQAVPSFRDFKIIAITPLENCDTRITKVLQSGRTYYFYSDYEITENGIFYKNESPDQLYHKGRLRIQISAIAGQNGSGKSTLIELLFMTINNIASTDPRLEHSLRPVRKLHTAIYLKTDRYLRIIVQGTNIQVSEHRGEAWSDYLGFELGKLFYSIAINYSHYAYNSLTFKRKKDWITPLFHKNDGYQTPIVLSPMRTKGNIDINIENKLVNQRLITNLLRPDDHGAKEFRRLTDNLTATDLVLKLNLRKNQNILYRKNGEDIYLSDLHLDKDLILERINKIYPFNYDQIDRQQTVNSIGLDYVICKLISISINYSEYSTLYSQENGDFDAGESIKLLPKILRQKSHVTFKLMQILHFFKYPELGYKSGIHELGVLSTNIEKVIEKKHTHKIKLIALIPPPIFSTEVVLSPENRNQKRFSFNTLSSGEKQMIFSVSTVLYHLFNLDSIVSSNKIIYRNINIMLEEIELYFHPEMQRKYISELRRSIIRLGLENIRRINICFITHSPFILSDIPDRNVMFLKLDGGRTQQTNLNKKTFGANIHDLLADGFFMENGFSGSLSIRRINETINYLNTSRRIKELNDDENIQQKEKEELEDLCNSIDGENRNEHLKIIKSIGEGVIAKKLMEMYSEIFLPDQKENIKLEIQRLQELLAKI